MPPVFQCFLTGDKLCKQKQETFFAIDINICAYLGLRKPLYTDDNFFKCPCAYETGISAMLMKDCFAFKLFQIPIPCFNFSPVYLLKRNKREKGMFV